jgi:hypothetical protein
MNGLHQKNEQKETEENGFCIVCTVYFISQFYPRPDSYSKFDYSMQRKKKIQTFV